MDRPRLNVRDTPHNHERWGKLVKTWSTGKNYVRHEITKDKPFPTKLDDPAEFPRPDNFGQFVAQCQAAGVELFFDDGVKDEDVTGQEADMQFKIVDVPPNTAVVRLPHKDKIAESEARLMNENFDYPLPEFYVRIHGTKPKPAETSSPVQKATLHAERVGEYTINTCM